MTPEAYLRALASAITRQEDLNDAEARDVLYELALRIYALLLRELPENALERSLQWPRLRAAITISVINASDRIAQSVYSRLTATEALVTPIAAEYVGLAPDVLKPRDTRELLDNTLVLSVPVSRLFTPNPATGLSPFAQQLLRLLERAIQAGFFGAETTPQIAARIIGTRTVAGVTRPVVTRGTVANAWRERLRSIVAAALWGTVTPAALRAQAAAILTSGETERAALWRWNAVLDPRTCPVCRPLHNTTAPAPSAFPRGAPPLHPLCVLGNTEVSTGGLVAATRAFYSGNVVTIRTQGGSEVSVTAQHPMLTSRGWVRAELLLNSDQLLRHTSGYPVSGNLPDLNHSPIQAQEVFEAFRASGGVSTGYVPPAPVYFHGDGASYQREIEVVWAHGQFQHGIPPNCFQGTGQLHCVRGDSELTREPCYGALDLLFFAANAASCGLVGICDEALSLLRRGVGHAEIHRLAAAPLHYPSLVEPVYEDVARASIGFRQLFDALPGLVTLDQVVNVNVVAVHDLPVYDFTTRSGIYSVGHLLSHNCRCVVLPE